MQSHMQFSFCDGKPREVIHEFFPSVPTDYKIVEVPKHLVFYSLHYSTISKVQIALKDQYDSLDNFTRRTDYNTCIDYAAWVLNSF